MENRMFRLMLEVAYFKALLILTLALKTLNKFL